MRRILILLQILCHIGQIVTHARHRSSPAAGIESRARHNAEAPLICLVLRGQRDILGDGVAHERVKLVPVHQAEIHVEEAHAVELRCRLCVVVRAVLADAMRHLMPEHGSKLIHIAAQPTNKTAIDRHIVRRIASGIKDGTVRHRPCEGERIHTEYIVAVLHKALHNLID